MPTAEATPLRRDTATAVRVTNTNEGPGLIAPRMRAPRMLSSEIMGSMRHHMPEYSHCRGRAVAMGLRVIGSRPAAGKHRLCVAAVDLVDDRPGQMQTPEALRKVAGVHRLGSRQEAPILH